MTDETETETVRYGRRLRDLEAFAFRTGSALAGHGEPPAAVRERQYTATGSIERRLDAIERVLSALARSQGIDPAATD
jgi:hypothetical protein